MPNEEMDDIYNFKLQQAEESIDENWSRKIQNLAVCLFHAIR